MKKTSHPTEDCTCSDCVWKRAMVKVGKKGRKRKYDIIRNDELQAKREALGIDHFASSVPVKRKGYSKCRTGLTSTHGNRKEALLFMFREEQAVLDVLAKAPSTVPQLVNNTFNKCIPDYCKPSCTISNHTNRLSRTMHRLLDRGLVTQRKVNITTVKHYKYRGEPVIYDKPSWMYTLHNQGIVNKLLYRFRRWKLSIRTTWCDHCELIVITRLSPTKSGKKYNVYYLVPKPIKYVIGLMRRL